MMMKAIGIIGHWPLDGHTVVLPTAGDISRNGNGGTCTDVTLTTGIHGETGGACLFNGTTSFVNVGISQFYKSRITKMSVSLLVYIDPADFDATYKGLVNTATNSPLGNDGMYISLDDRGGATSPLEGIQFAPATTGPTAYGGYKSDDNVISSVGWYHIVCTYGDGTGKIYINGIENTNVFRATTGNFASRNTDMYIGAVNDDTRNLAGKIAKVRIYSYVMSAGQVLTLYNSYTWSLIV